MARSPSQRDRKYPTDRSRGGLSDEVAEQFDRRVREALEAEGHTVVDATGTEE